MQKFIYHICLLLSILCSTIAQAQQSYVVEQRQVSTMAADSIFVDKTIDRAYELLASAPDSAMILYKQALARSSNGRYNLGKVISLRGMGATYASMGKYDSSLSLYKQALVLAEHTLPASSQIEYLYNNIAAAYVNFGELQEASLYYFKVLELTGKSGNIPGRVQAYNNLSEIYGLMGEYGKGFACIDSALRIAPEKKDSRDMVPYLYINQASLLSARGKFAEALEAGEKALKFNKEGLQMDIVDAETLLVMAEVYGKTGRATEQKQTLVDAVAVSTRYQLGKEKALLALGMLCNREGDYRSAIRYLKNALILAEGTQSLKELADINGNLATAYLKAGDYRKAATHFQSASVLKDSLNTVENTRNINHAEWKYRTALKDKEIAEKQLLLNRQHQQIGNKNFIIAGISIGCVLLLLLLVFISRSYRQKQAIQKQGTEITVWKATLQGEEKERRRLARELHDNIGGSLSNVKMWFGSIREKHEELLDEQDYTEAMQLLDHTLNEVRNTAHHLMPELLLRFGLAEAVGIFCKNVQRASGVVIDYQYIGYIEKLEAGLELLIYRSIQELVQNVVKHAAARKCLLQLSQHDRMLSITIEDDGKGMDTTLLESHQGMGLQHVRQGIIHLNGQFELQSTPGRGTTINIDIALGSQQAATTTTEHEIES